MYYIYKIVNKINNKIYIGQSKNVKLRWYKHTSNIKSNNKKLLNHPLYNSMRKYGIENFYYEIINQYNTLEECNVAEVNYIKEYKSQDRSIGYNIHGGGLNSPIADSTKELLSKIGMGELNHFYGKKHTEESLIKMRNAKLGKIATTETKKKMSIKRSGENNGMFGKNHTQETKDKISNTRKLKLLNDPNYSKKKNLSKSIAEVSKKVICEADLADSLEECDTLT